MHVRRAIWSLRGVRWIADYLAVGLEADNPVAVVLLHKDEPGQELHRQVHNFPHSCGRTARRTAMVRLGFRLRFSSR